MKSYTRKSIITSNCSLRLTPGTILFWASLLFISMVGGIGLQTLPNQLVFAQEFTEGEVSTSEDTFIDDTISTEEAAATEGVSVAEICSDQIDNDNDQVIDDLDPEGCVPQDVGGGGASTTEGTQSPDSDGDGVPDNEDQCPNDPSAWSWVAPCPLTGTGQSEVGAPTESEGEEFTPEDVVQPEGAATEGVSVTEICSDQIDNDNDQVIDDLDPEGCVPADGGGATTSEGEQVSTPGEVVLPEDAATGTGVNSCPVDLWVSSFLPPYNERGRITAPSVNPITLPLLKVPIAPDEQWVEFTTDNRDTPEKGGSARLWSYIVLDLCAEPDRQVIKQMHGVGSTFGYSDAGDEDPQTYQSYRGRASAENIHEVIDNSQGSGTVNIKVTGSAADPLAPGASNIDYEFIITLIRSADTVLWSLEGEHDGFPAYEIFIGKSNVYFFTPKDTGQTILSLNWPMEFSGDDVSRSGTLSINEANDKDFVPPQPTQEGEVITICETQFDLYYTCPELLSPVLDSDQLEQPTP